jgi:hypothetical protein
MFQQQSTGSGTDGWSNSLDIENRRGAESCEDSPVRAGQCLSGNVAARTIKRALKNLLKEFLPARRKKLVRPRV